MRSRRSSARWASRSACGSIPRSSSACAPSTSARTRARTSEGGLPPPDGHRVPRGARAGGSGGSRSPASARARGEAGARRWEAHGPHPEATQVHRARVIVVDTNLLVYLYVSGQNTAQAETVLVRDPVWVAPLLWRSEFRN